MHDALIYMVGPAGSGKSTLTGALAQWMTLNAMDTVLVNLDPGALDLPYQPDIDIRERLNLNQVMKEYGLGPNGAQVVCADLLALQLDWLLDELKDLETQYVLVDTPGQMELFLFRESARTIVNHLSPNSMLALLFDPLLSRSANGFITQLMLASTVSVRFPLPQLSVLSKADLLEPDQTARLGSWSTDLDSLYLDASEADGAFDGTLALEMLKVMQMFSFASPLHPVSVQEHEVQGLEDLYVAVQDALGHSEDLSNT